MLDLSCIRQERIPRVQLLSRCGLAEPVDSRVEPRTSIAGIRVARDANVVYRHPQPRLVIAAGDGIVVGALGEKGRAVANNGESLSNMDF